MDDLLLLADRLRPYGGEDDLRRDGDPLLPCRVVEHLRIFLRPPVEGLPGLAHGVSVGRVRGEDPSSLHVVVDCEALIAWTVWHYLAPGLGVRPCGAPLTDLEDCCGEGRTPLSWRSFAPFLVMVFMIDALPGAPEEESSPLEALPEGEPQCRAQALEAEALLRVEAAALPPAGLEALGLLEFRSTR